jgi:hypothetical protein
MNRTHWILFIGAAGWFAVVAWLACVYRKFNPSIPTPYIYTIRRLSAL